MTHPLRAAFAAQAAACAGLGSPVMARLCHLLADRLDPAGPPGPRLLDWPGDLGPAGDSVPLGLCAALILRLWPGDATVDLNRADFHGRWIDWRAPPA